MRKPAASDDRERFDELAEHLGEDPARFLTLDALEKGDLLRARINGIDRAEVAKAWIAVERRLAGRKTVIQLLEDRLEHLEDVGDRDERTQRRDVDPDRRSGFRFVDVDGDTYERTANPYTESIRDKIEDDSRGTFSELARTEGGS